MMLGMLYGIETERPKDWCFPESDLFATGPVPFAVAIVGISSRTMSGEENLLPH
jgi:hypothetical protein